MIEDGKILVENFVIGRYLPMHERGTDPLKMILSGFVGGSNREIAEFCGQPFGVDSRGKIVVADTLYEQLLMSFLETRGQTNALEVRRTMLDYPKIVEQREVLRDWLAERLARGEAGSQGNWEETNGKIEALERWGDDLISLYRDLLTRGVEITIPEDLSKGPLRIEGLRHMSGCLAGLRSEAKIPTPLKEIELRPGEPVMMIGGNNSGKTHIEEEVVQAGQEANSGRLVLANKYAGPLLVMRAIPAECEVELGESHYTAQLKITIKIIEFIKTVRERMPDQAILLVGDELFMGTDEREGAALYRSFMRWGVENGLYLLLSSNNELVFDPGVGRMVTVVDRQLMPVSSVEEIEVQRTGVQLLREAGMPEEIIERAAVLAGAELREDDVEKRQARGFSMVRTASVLGLMGGMVAGIYEGISGMNARIFNLGAGLFDGEEWMREIFGTDRGTKLKRNYRDWLDRADEGMLDLKILSKSVQGVKEAIELIELLNKEASRSSVRSQYKKDQEEDMRNYIERIVKLGEGLDWKAIKEVEVEGIKKRLEAIGMDELERVIRQISELNGELNLEDLKMEVIRLHQLLKEDFRFGKTKGFDEVAGFAGLALAFTELGFCKREEVIEGDGRQLEIKGLWHPGLVYELGEGAVSNDVSFSGDNPVLLLGSAEGGKTRLLEAIGIFTLLITQFDRGPAEWCKIGKGIIGVIGLVEGLRDPERQTSGGKWLRNQSGIADLVEQAKDGGYLVLIDEPSDGGNAVEGRATMMAVAEYLQERGNLVVMTTHQHRVVEKFKQTIGVECFGSGLGKNGRFSFAPGEAHSSGLKIALEKGMPKGIINGAAEILRDQGVDEGFYPF